MSGRNVLKRWKLYSFSDSNQKVFHFIIPEPDQKRQLQTDKKAHAITKIAWVLLIFKPRRVPAGCRNKVKSEKSGGMYVTFFTSQTGKCRSVKPMCQWHIGSVGSACLQVEEPTSVASVRTRLQTSPKGLHFGENLV